MSPNEAAEVLGVSPTAAPDVVQRAFEARLAEAGADLPRRDAVTAARDALLAASAWQAPSGVPPQPPAPGYQQPTYAQPGDPQAPGVVPPLPQAPGYAQAPGGLPPQPPQPGYPPAPGYQQPTYPHPGYAPAPGGVPPQPPYGAAPGTTAPWYPAPPARRRLSTGAILGITLGSIGAALVILIVAVVVIFAVAHESSRLAAPESGSSASPFDDPSDPPSDDPSSDAPSPGDESAVDDVDGVHVHYVDGWTFELTSGQTCTAATVTVGFADTPDGDEVDQWTTTVDLEQGVPLSFTVPDSASVHDYAGIDAVDCGQA